jgi:hypothetical protein
LKFFRKRKKKIYNVVARFLVLIKEVRDVFSRAIKERFFRAF